MIKYYFDGKEEARVEIGLQESMNDSENFTDMLMNFALEVQTAHMLIVLRASQLIESFSKGQLQQENIGYIENALLKWSSVDTEKYLEFKNFMESS